MRHVRVTLAAVLLLVGMLAPAGPAGAEPAHETVAPPAAKLCWPEEGSVARLYQAFFFRAPDYGGFLYWMDRYYAGMSLADIADLFTYSDEFYATYGGLTNEDFVWLVYQNVLGRAPDPGGFAFWIDQLYYGLPWGWMMVEFSESPEYIGLAGPCPGIDTGVSAAALADECGYGDMLACDYLYWVTPVGSEAEYYAMTCGYRAAPDAGTCAYRFGRFY